MNLPKVFLVGALAVPVTATTTTKEPCAQISRLVQDANQNQCARGQIIAVQEHKTDSRSNGPGATRAGASVPDVHAL